jgi:threonine dehydrogenase-like Zn-dependent dehydrogenase
MRALWLENCELRLRDDVDLPAPPPGEAMVRVLCAGVCNTDLEMVKGYYPFAGVPGHEFVGRVEAAPSASHWVGRRVVGEINVTCGGCGACRAGRPTHCENRTVLGIRNRNGTFAEALLLPIANLHPVPDALADDVACFTEPLAAALQIQEQVRIEEGDRVVVIGAGKLGHLVAQTLALTRCDLLVVGKDRRRLTDLSDRGLRTATGDDLLPAHADVVVECTGNPEGLALAARSVRPRGTIVLKSTYHGTTSLDVSALVVNEVTLVGSRCGPFAPALQLLAERRVDVRPLIHARYPLDQGLAAFAHAARPGTLKVQIAATE